MVGLRRIAARMNKRMLANGYEAVGGPPEKFAEWIRAETAKWAPIVQASGAKVD